MGGSDSLELTLMTSDPLCCPILAGRECTIEICKGNLGLGLSIVGGCDTLLVRSANVLCLGICIFVLNNQHIQQHLRQCLYTCASNSN